jgi:hypothetical protein
MAHRKVAGAGKGRPEYPRGQAATRNDVHGTVWFGHAHATLRRVLCFSCETLKSLCRWLLLSRVLFLFSSGLCNVDALADVPNSLLGLHRAPGGNESGDFTAKLPPVSSCRGQEITSSCKSFIRLGNWNYFFCVAAHSASRATISGVWDVRLFCSARSCSKGAKRSLRSSRGINSSRGSTSKFQTMHN